MRNFTKEHNDIKWLFPIPPKYRGCTDDDYANRRFDQCEKEAERLLVAAYGEEKESFSKDDMIDAFMKGSSEAYRDSICTMLTMLPEEFQKSTTKHAMNLIQRLLDKYVTENEYKTIADCEMNILRLNLKDCGLLKE